MLEFQVIACLDSTFQRLEAQDQYDIALQAQQKADMDTFLTEAGAPV